MQQWIPVELIEIVLLSTLIFQLCMYFFPHQKQLLELTYMIGILWSLYSYIQSLLEVVHFIDTTLSPIWDAIVPIGLSAANLFMIVLFPLAPLLAFFFSLLSLQLIKSLIMPLFVMAFVAIVANRIDSSSSLTRFNELIRSVLVFLLFIFLSLFTFLLSVSGGLSYLLADQLKPSLANLLQNSIPIVGSLFTEGLSTVKGITSLSALAGGSVLGLTLFTVAVVPIIKIVCDAFLFRLLGAVLSFVGSDRVGGLFDDLGKLLFILAAWCLFFICIILMVALYIFLLFQLLWKV